MMAFMHLILGFTLILGQMPALTEIHPEEKPGVVEAGPTTPGEPVANPQRLTLNDALLFTLENQLDLQISLLNIRAQQGVAQNLAGPFDPLFNGNVTQEYSQDIQNNVVRTKRNAYDTRAFVSASKRSRLGTNLLLSAEIERVDNILSFPKITNTATIQFLVDQPLLRDLWYSPDTVNEEAAWLELWAVYMDSFQSTAQHILDTTIQYWELVAAEKLVEISVSAEERLTTLAHKIERLIEEEQLARVDINQAWEKIVEQELLTLQFQQDSYTAFELLKITIGDVDIAPFDLEHPYVLDDYKDIHYDIEKLEEVTPYLIAQAIKYRYDIQAASIREREANVLLQGAYNAELPRVNVFGGVRKRDFHLGGGSEDYFSSIEMDHPETDWTVGVNVSVPLYNDAARGLVRQRQTQKVQSTMRTRFITQTSVSTLRTAISNHISLIRQMKQANERVALNRRLIDDEWKKLRAGFSTLFVLLDFETRLTDALSERNRIYKFYMQNIASLRFLTGSLFESDACLSIVALEDVTTVPGI